MGWLKAIIAAFKTRPRFSEMLEAFKAADKSCRFDLYKELLKEYQTTGIKEASVLAVQVVNYLMGDDFDEVYRSVSEDVKQSIDRIKGLIEEKAAEKMRQSEEIREFIVRSIMVKMVLFSSRYGDKWVNSICMKNVENLIAEYGNKNEFENSDNFEKYMLVASQFHEKRKDS